MGRLGAVMGEMRAARFRFGMFEADSGTGELWRKGVRVRIHAQPFAVLCLLLDRPGEVLTREEISRELWPDGTFVDYEHGVNSAVNRLREALGDRAASPRYVETLARRGYRFVAPVQRIGVATDDFSLIRQPSEDGEALAAVRSGAGTPALGGDEAPGEEGAPVLGEKSAVAGTDTEVPEQSVGWAARLLARPEDLPRASPALVRVLFMLLQAMYLSFYVGALANLGEVRELLGFVPGSDGVFAAVLGTAALLIPVRVFLLCAVMFRAPGFRGRFLRLWWGLLVADVLWALSPFLLLHHISFGLALACVAVLVYSPFAQRSLVLMGAGDPL